MSIDTKLYDATQQDAAVSGLVGDRVWPLRIPQGRLQDIVAGAGAITYEIVDVPHPERTQTSAGPAYPRIRINCWGVEYDQARDIAAAVFALLDHRQDVAGALSSFVDNKRDRVDPDTGLYRRIVDVLQWTSEE
ncbi:MAG: DUF3168 domain-containing protein [Candidatus Dormibacteraeota bacterium]|nr:DUF3168 domain-containing protein [Candidatus Dormibacteraeota bacterium]